MPPRILIMVLSYNEPPYSDLMKAQIETWDSVDVPGVSSLYYHGVGKGDPLNKSAYGCATNESAKWRELVFFPCSDDYYKMHWKFKLALDHAFLYHQHKWDIIFRTNSSSYVSKSKLVEFVNNLGVTENLYAGMTMRDSNHDGGDCVSGAGIFLSKNYAAILRDELTPEENCEEDVLIGRILRPHGAKAIHDQSRVDYPRNQDMMRSTYHIRFKTSNRIHDANSMRLVHEKIK